MKIANNGDNRKIFIFMTKRHKSLALKKCCHMPNPLWGFFKSWHNIGCKQEAQIKTGYWSTNNQTNIETHYFCRSPDCEPLTDWDKHSYDFSVTVSVYNFPQYDWSSSARSSSIPNSNSTTLKFHLPKFKLRKSLSCNVRGNKTAWNTGSYLYNYQTSAW